MAPFNTAAYRLFQQRLKVGSDRAPKLVHLDVHVVEFSICNAA
jgi:hypothetical protein